MKRFGLGGQDKIPRSGKLARRAAAVATLCALLVYWYQPLVLNNLDVRSRDLVFKLRQAPAPPRDVVVVAIDEKSVKQYGRWPWPRAVQAELIAGLKRLGASVIALDIIYLRPQDPVQDAALAQSLSLPGAPVIGGYFFRTEQEIPPSERSLTMLEMDRIKAVLERPGARRDTLLSFPFVEANQPELATQLNGAGFFNYIPDQDGLLRNAPLVLRYRNGLYPSLALLTLAKELGREISLSLTPEGVGSIHLGDLSIPVDSSARFMLNFYNGQAQIETLSAADILAGKLPPKALQDRMVFLGVTEIGIADVRPTPVDPSFPGVAIHATVVANVLQGFYLYRDNRTLLINVALMALVPLLMVWGLSALQRPIFMVAAFLATISLLWWLFYWLVAERGLLISFVYPAVAIASGYLSFQAYYSLVIQRHTRFLRQAFSSYVSPALVDEIVQDPGALKLAGAKRLISVLFSDIRGFTSVSELLPPEQLVATLNQYLDPMTEIVMDEKGTLDKYIGDAVMAIYNAPLTVPDHAERAAASALRMLDALALLNQDLEQAGSVRLDIGIGIHTGEAVVGNMGSKRRFDYTAIGDTVNLASRLEGQTKFYGVNVILSESTRAQLGERFLCRRLDRLRVVGRAQPVEIYQLFQTSDDSALRDLAKRYNQALEEYFSGRFEQAIEAFLAIAADHPEDKPTRILLQRCRRYLEEMPAPDWGGIFVAQEK